MFAEKINNSKDFERLFISYNEQIFRLVFFKTGFNKELAQDIAQDIFLKVWEKRENFDPTKSSLKNWIYTIAKNKIIDYYRTRKKVEVEYNDELAKTIYTKKEDAELSERVFKMIGKLSEEEREIITLRYIQDYSVKEISSILEKNYSATKVQLHRAIKKLRELVEEQNER